MNALVDTKKSEEIKKYIEKSISVQKAISFIDRYDGRSFYNTITPIAEDNGSVDKVFLHVKDITELELLKKYISKIEHFYKSIVENIHEGLGLTDQNGNLIYVNPQLVVATDLKEKNLIGSNIFELLGIDKEIGAMSFPIELIYSKQDDYGNLKHYGIHILKKEIYNDEMGYYFVLKDITERMKYQEHIHSLLKEKNKRIWNLNKAALEFSHEMLEPLVTIGGYTEQLIESIETMDFENIERCCRTITFSAKRLSYLNKEMNKKCRLLSNIKNQD